jgi:hypothetical protein
MKRLSAGHTVSRGLSIFTANIVPFLLIVALVRAPVIALTYFGVLSLTAQEDALARSFVLLVSSLLTIVFGQIATGAVTYGVVQQLRGRKASFGRCLRVAAERLGAIIGVSLLAAILTMFAAMLFVIPGIIAMCAFYVAVPVAVSEDASVSGALRRSRDLTRGSRWQVLGVIVLLALLAMAIAFAVGFPLGMAFGTSSSVTEAFKQVIAIPAEALGAVVAAVTYHDLRTAKEGGNADDIAQVFD